MQTSIGQPGPFGAGPFPTSRAESASAPDGSTTSSTNSATVTASDFLQLLVSEMKNQDPTANTDPNEYINQLVQVNSLEQLIQINQDLGDTSSAQQRHLWLRRIRAVVGKCSNPNLRQTGCPCQQPTGGEPESARPFRRRRAGGART